MDYDIHHETMSLQNARNLWAKMGLGTASLDIGVMVAEANGQGHTVSLTKGQLSIVAPPLPEDEAEHACDDCSISMEWRVGTDKAVMRWKGPARAVFEIIGARLSGGEL